MISLISPDEKIEYRIDESIFYLRRMPAEKHAEIENRHTRRIKEGGEWRSEKNSTAILLDSIDYILTGWSGVIDRPGGRDDAPCTTMTKKNLPAGVMLELIGAVSEADRQSEDAASAELENLQKYLLFKKDFPTLDCKSCKEQYLADDVDPDCDSCNMVTLDPANEPAIRLYSIISNSLISRLPLVDAVSLFAPGMSREGMRILILKLMLIDASEKEAQWQLNLNYLSPIREALR